MIFIGRQGCSKTVIWLAGQAFVGIIFEKTEGLTDLSGCFIPTVLAVFLDFVGAA
jgi:hypothetical protein